MARVLILFLAIILCFLFLLFAMFNDSGRAEVGGMSYMMGVSAIGILMCIAALVWLNAKDGNNPPRNGDEPPDLIP